MRERGGTEPHPAARLTCQQRRQANPAHGYAVEMFADGPAFFEAYRPGWEGCVLVDALIPE